MIFSRRFTQQLLDLLQFLIILVAAIVILVPIYWIVSGAFKQQVGGYIPTETPFHSDFGKF